MTRWGPIVLLWLAGLGAAAQYGKISVAFGPLAEMYPEMGPALGWLVSLVGLVGIVFGVSAGLYAGRIGLRRGLIWALWVGAALSGLQALDLSFAAFLVSRVVEGVSHLAIVVAAPTLIAQLAQERDRGAALTLWSTFFSVSFAGLAVLGVPLMAAGGVGALFAAHAVWMAVMAAILMRLLPAVPRDPAPAPDPGLLARHLAIYRSPRIAAPAAGWLFYTFCFVSLLTLLPPFLQPGHRAVVIGAMPLVAIAVSLTLGVWLLRYRSAVWIVVAGFAASAGCALALLVWPGSVPWCLALAAAMGLVQGASFAAVPQLNATAEARAQANGALAQTGNIGNTLGTPVIATIIAGAGQAGLMLTLALALSLGATTHLGLAAARMRGMRSKFL